MGADGSLFEVDIDHLHSTGNAVLALGDGLEAVGRSGVLGARSAWGHGSLETAGARFDDRFTDMVNGLSDELVGAGRSLRATAEAYRDMDAANAMRLAGLNTTVEPDWQTPSSVDR